MSPLQSFVRPWGVQYRKEVAAIPMFDRSKPWPLSHEQILFLVMLLYPQRGHFLFTLNELAAKAPSLAFKKVIFENLKDELGIIRGKSLPSHEELFLRFADKWFERGTFIRDIKIGHKGNLSFIREFNEGNLAWILTHEWDYVWAWFAAYEWFDNPDYELLYQLAVYLGASNRELEFFDVHRGIKHYGPTTKLLKPIFERNPDAVREGFEYAARRQLNVWQQISDTIEAHK